MSRRPFTLLASALLAATVLAGCQPALSAPASTPAASKPAPSKSAGQAQAKPAASIGGDAAAGKQLFLSKGCVACHRISGMPEAQGTIGPALTGFASRDTIAAVIPNTPENVKRWLLNPPAVKPGTAMPNLGLSDAEATNLTAFLETLK